MIQYGKRGKKGTRMSTNPILRVLRKVVAEKIKDALEGPFVSSKTEWDTILEKTRKTKKMEFHNGKLLYKKLELEGSEKEAVMIFNDQNIDYSVVFLGNGELDLYGFHHYFENGKDKSLLKDVLEKNTFKDHKPIIQTKREKPYFGTMYHYSDIHYFHLIYSNIQYEFELEGEKRDFNLDMFHLKEEIAEMFKPIFQDIKGKIPSMMENLKDCNDPLSKYGCTLEQKQVYIKKENDTYPVVVFGQEGKQHALVLYELEQSKEVEKVHFRLFCCEPEHKECSSIEQLLEQFSDFSDKHKEIYEIHYHYMSPTFFDPKGISVFDQYNCLNAAAFATELLEFIECFEMFREELAYPVKRLVKEGKLTFACDHEINAKYDLRKDSKRFLHAAESGMMWERYHEDKKIILDDQYCFDCGERVSYVLDGEQLVPIETECFKQKEVEVMIPVPTGELIFADWLEHGNEVIRYLSESSFDVNTLKGLIETTLSYARAGIGHFFVGNSCPSVLKKEDNILIGNNSYDDDDEEIPLDKEAESVGSVCTDLWWVTVCDRSIYEKIAIEKFGEHKGKEMAKEAAEHADVSLKVEPGTYKLRCFMRVKDDYELYATLEKVE